MKDCIEDEAGDAMLSSNDVKFIASNSQGDAKIDINVLEKVFTGMTKDELMRYANDPFWVRLRWIFFVVFWGLWASMLIGAIFIIIDSPKCTAPVPLVWYKQGPLVFLRNHDDLAVDELEQLKSIDARGAIITIPAQITYHIGLNNSNGQIIKNRIKTIVEKLQSVGINPIVDLTPNIVEENDSLFQLALQPNQTIAKDAFLFVNHKTRPNNWLSKVNGSAWSQIQPNLFALSQFGDGLFDLQLNNVLAKERLENVIRQLCSWGVLGYRLHNAKHFIISSDLADDQPAASTKFVHTEYGYWLHTHTTYQSGLAELIADLSSVVKSNTAGEGFLTLADNVDRIEAFRLPNGQLSFELPIIGVLPLTLASPPVAGTTQQLYNELMRIDQANSKSTWVQWYYDNITLYNKSIGISEYNAFVLLLPGVPVGHFEHFNVSRKSGNSKNVLLELEDLRQTQSYMHGQFDVFMDASNTTIAYKRIKPGNPGFLVVYNPTNKFVSADFTHEGISDQLTVHLLSNNYNVANINEKVKVQSDSIPVDAFSVIILTYVPSQLA